MRYRVSSLPLWLDEDESLLVARAAERLGLAPDGIRDLTVVRRSLDARKKQSAARSIDRELPKLLDLHYADPIHPEGIDRLVNAPRVLEPAPGINFYVGAEVGWRALH